MPVVLDGRAVAATIKSEISEQVAALAELGNRAPQLTIFLVGSDPASWTYVQNKKKDCQEVGIHSQLLQFEEEVEENELLSAISSANEAPEVDGIIVQLPLPSHISKEKIIDKIHPSKDVDGFHHLNFGRLGTGLPAYIPATPNGILELLRHYDIQTRGLHAVVVGRSYLVGLPMSILLARGSDPGDATVTLTHRHTRDLAQYTRTADLLVSAVGKPRFITADMVKEGAIVVDVGITRVEDPTATRGYRLIGDIDYGAVLKKASYITPVPNGVGPMTRAALLMNTVRAARKEVCILP